MLNEIRSLACGVAAKTSRLRPQSGPTVDLLERCRRGSGQSETAQLILRLLSALSLIALKFANHTKGQSLPIFSDIADLSYDESETRIIESDGSCECPLSAVA